MHILGTSTIYLATFACLATILLYLTGQGREKAARASFAIAAGALAIAVAVLWILILTHRFDFHYVRSYSSTDLPLGYLVSTLWGGQEGTLLLWMFFIGILGLVLLRTAGKYERGAMMTIAAFMISILVILIKRSPFALAQGPAAVEGAGLNPLLQDFWMVIHPPIMFFGFALTIFPFALVVAGLAQRDYTGWIPRAWRWTLSAWTVLFMALAMGGYWAYKVLGWGGFWAWDPVENSSMIPWLFASGGIHALIMVKKRKALGKTASFMLIMTFLAVLYGSFLTRSGILADFSVHSFLDLGINNFLIAALAIFAILGLGMFVWRSRRMPGDVAYHSMTVRDFFVTLAALTFGVAGFLVIVGMSAPLLTRFGDNPAAVTLDYYFFATTPVAFVLLVSLALFPFMKWYKASKPIINPTAVWSLLASLATGMIAAVFGITDPLYIALVVVAAFAVYANGWLTAIEWRGSGRVNGGYVAHIGLAVMLIGAAITSAYETKETIGLPLNHTVNHAGFEFTYKGARPDLVSDHETPYVVEVAPAGDPGGRFVAAPRMFHLDYNNSTMRKPHIKKYFARDLYISPLDEVVPPTPGANATFTEDQTIDLGGYNLTFLGFDMDGGDPHQGGGHGQRFAANFEVRRQDRVDTIAPAMASTAQGLVPVPVSFDGNQAELTVEHIHAGDRTVEVRLTTAEHRAQGESPVFWVEVAFKPMINLVWAGTIIMLIGGMQAFWARRRESLRELAPDAPAREPAQAPSEISTAPARPIPIPEEETAVARSHEDKGLAST